MNKNLALGAVGIGTVLIIAFLVVQNTPVTPQSPEDTGDFVSDETDSGDSARIQNPGAGSVDPSDTTTSTATFAGTLEQVDTGCFADGECSIEVDGKHVTVLMGWSRDTVGSVQGVEGFGDLEQYVGSRVEVYAREVGEGDYTLYGDEAYYVRLAPGATPRSPEQVPGTGEEQIGSGCVVGGCSSQLCIDAPGTDVVSTCEWREEYACYRNATCERQADGRCGWTMTPTLATCIEEANASATY